MDAGVTLALSGGVGGAKLALGLSHVLEGRQLTIVANTGDDFEHFGLYISPDVDTLLYTLAGINNPETGWGRDKETWSCMTMLGRLGGETWFRLGDKDLGLHLYRTGRLKAGLRLSQVVEELRQHFRIGPELLPMSDQPVRTEVQTDDGTMSFQRYFVYARCEPRIQALRWVGASDANPTPRFDRLLQDSKLRAIIICPSNPYLSIDPILAVPGVRDGIRRSETPVVAVSPIVGGRALKGPTAKLMAELGADASAAAVAEHYSGLINGIVIDREDAGLVPAIEARGIACWVGETIMSTLDDRIQLAQDVLDFAGRLRKDG